MTRQLLSNPSHSLVNGASNYFGCLRIHFAAWFGVSANERNFVFHDTLNIHGTGSDGSVFTFHAVVHFSVSASGEVISFSDMTCG